MTCNEVNTMTTLVPRPTPCIKTLVETLYPKECDYIRQSFPNADPAVQCDYVYQLVSYQRTLKSKKAKARRPDFSKVLVGWNSAVFTQAILEEEEQDTYFENPMASQLSDSVVPCSKCGSTKTFNIERQTRSLDEPTTIITICYACKHRHKYSG